MDNILRDMYCEGIFPQNLLEADEQLTNALETFGECERELIASLAGGDKEKLFRLVDAQSEIGGCQSVDNFLMGMRLGARLTAALLG